MCHFQKLVIILFFYYTLSDLSSILYPLPTVIYLKLQSLPIEWVFFALLVVLFLILLVFQFNMLFPNYYSYLYYIYQYVLSVLTQKCRDQNPLQIYYQFQGATVKARKEKRKYQLGIL